MIGEIIENQVEAPAAETPVTQETPAVEAVAETPAAPVTEAPAPVAAEAPVVEAPVTPDVTPEISAATPDVVAPVTHESFVRELKKLLAKIETKAEDVIHYVESKINKIQA